MYVAELLVVA